jgi:hypothetical protein
MNKTLFVWSVNLCYALMSKIEISLINSDVLGNANNTLQKQFHLCPNLAVNEPYLTSI